MTERDEARDERDRLRSDWDKQDARILNVLGAALGYPWFKDDQGNFPGATESDGVCTGEHVPETIAAEAAKCIEALKADRDRLAARVAELEGPPVHDMNRYTCPSCGFMSVMHCPRTKTWVCHMTSPQCRWFDSKPPCEHEWVDIRNDTVLSGEMCRKCNALQAGNDNTE